VDLLTLARRASQRRQYFFSGSHALAWEPILDAPASCFSSTLARRESVPTPARGNKNNAGAWEQEPPTDALVFPLATSPANFPLDAGAS